MASSILSEDFPTLSTAATDVASQSVTFGVLYFTYVAPTSNPAANWLPPTVNIVSSGAM